ncbi:MAG: hypothetical protein HMLKMBBP_00356 [Planctomycetes bacterium]|nr:hypothetical protein [Planctomycetota bacterium]
MTAVKRLPAVARTADAACCPPDGRSRTLPGTASQARAVAVFKALADATRLQVFALVASRPEPICVCDIVSQFDVSQPTISHHLRVLRDAGLVTATRRGAWMYYAADARGPRAARAALDALCAEGCTQSP